MTLTEFLKNNPATSCRTFGDFIKLNREEMGLSVRALAVKLDISPVYLSDIERHHRPVTQTVLNKFKIVFNIQENEAELLQDIVYLTRETVSPEIIRYLIANPEARQAIRKANLRNIHGSKFLNMVENEEKDLAID